MSDVRRSLAGLLFGLASIVGSLAVSGFWMQFTAFSPSHTRGAAHVVLGDSAIKNEIAKAIAVAVAPQLGVNPLDLQQAVVVAAGTTPGAELLEGVVADAHARLIGASDKPVQITPQQMVPLVGNEVAAVVPTVILDVPKVNALSIIREVLKWLVPIAAGLTLLLLILGFAAHPERAELLRSMAFLLLGMATLLALIGYIVPALILPLLSKNVWMAAVPRLAKDSLPLLIGSMFVLVGAGFACLAASGAVKRRDRWSQPVRTRYSEQRRWS